MGAPTRAIRRRGGRAAPQLCRKVDRTPSEWRALFSRVYLADQCFPGAVMAALVSADYLLGTDFQSRVKISDINRHLGYRRGRATAIDAPMTGRFSKFVAGRGLEVKRSTAAGGAFDELRHVLAADDCTFPIVGVDIEMVPQYDRRVTIKRLPGTTTIPPRTDHALVVLAADDAEVQFFDPTLRNPTGTLVQEKIDTPTFLTGWNKDPIIPNDRIWFTLLPRVERKAAKVPPRTLMDYSARGGKPKG